MSREDVKPSTVGRVLRHVLVPLTVTWLTGTLVALGVAYVSTQRAFDRSLLDDAHVLAANVKLETSSLRLGLTAREVDTILFDPTETQYFKVALPDGTLIAGMAGLDMPPIPAGATHVFADIESNGRTLRAVKLHTNAPRPFDIVVAETQVGRVALLENLLIYSLVPQGLLLLCLAGWIRRSVKADLQPLQQLRGQLSERSAGDLSPVRAMATTSEIELLVGTINSLFSRLERSVRAQREFASNVAHELRTPLAGIRVLVGYGLAQNDPASWRAQLERIGNSEARASRLVDQLLDLALAHEAESSLEIGWVRLDELVREAVLHYLPKADAAHVDLGALGLDDPVEVRGNAPLIDSILGNLIDNALRYGADSREERATVTVAIEHESDAVVLSVMDNGPSLPGESQAELMKRGIQGATGQLLGQGAGLGLALVAQYATLMNARMTLGSGPGGVGWLCSIRFPSGMPAAAGGS